MNNLFKTTCVVMLLASAVESQAQLSGSNIAEYQYGGLPGDTASFSTFYDRLVLNYNYKSLKASATLEQFHTPLPGSNYIKLSRFSLQYKSREFEIKAGNFYETIGRGILLRSFEIPGAILEDLSYRSRHYFHRDILGMSAKYNYKNFNAKFIYGNPLNYVFPPTHEFEKRRFDNIAALYAEYNIYKQTIGISGMRYFNGQNEKYYSMTTLSGNISDNVSYYTEFAGNMSDFSLNDFSKLSSFAIYGGLNLAFESFGLSAEYKNYKNFLIGTGINEPPALIKEHSYKVLNRSTHVLQPLNETGYQIELFYTFPDLSTLTFNNSLAINNFGNKFVYQEYFLEYDFSLANKHDIKSFIDFAEDPFKLEKNRISIGMNADWKIFNASSLRTEYEFQNFERLGKHYENQIFVLGYGYKSKLILNLVAETSNDSFIVSNGTKIWLGGNIKYQLNKNNAIQIFAGERRGGPACNAGVCYEVLDFKGVEIRLKTRISP